MRVRSGTEVEMLMAESGRGSMFGFALARSSGDLRRCCVRAESSLEPVRWPVDDRFDEAEEAVEPEEEEG